MLRCGHDMDSGAHSLAAELKFVHRFFPPIFFDILPRAEEQRAARTHGRAHRFFSRAGAVITQVALHHQTVVNLHLRHAKRAGEDAIRTGDTTRFRGAEHHAAIILLDGIGRANSRARRVFAMHANDRRGLDPRGAVHVVEVDHRCPAMRLAFVPSSGACAAAQRVA